ncbi:SCO family protein [Peribacillus sp. NPDC097295]|uniref:SCO family protein n=1 Tax=Peribacillus sp. NPDC097295 TaxID=3364402 RepID=UPI00381C5CAA
MKKIYIIFTTLLVIGIGSGIYYFTEYRQSKMEFPEDIVMNTQEGGTYSFSDLKPKVRLLEFMYLDCPDLCPNTTYQMQKIRDKLVKQDIFGDKVEFLTITFNPEMDTTDKIKTYAKAFDINETDGWEILRGTPMDTKKLTDQFDFLFRDSGTGEFVHSTATYLLDADNHVVKVFGMGEYDFDKEEVYKAIMKEVE